ncbi:hypothetical protein HHL19_22675 [Streptomyces sp. R302]|nr:hypothetical protein [Streptomyces sp. R301]NML81379.1 hypothetical protein [Streptomyces sp. R302]
MTIVAEPSRTGALTNTATVTAAQTDPAPGNNAAPRTTTVNNSRGCTIVGTSGADTLNGTYQGDMICALSGNDTANGGLDTDTCTTDPGDARVSCP